MLKDLNSGPFGAMLFYCLRRDPVESRGYTPIRFLLFVLGLPLLRLFSWLLRDPNFTLGKIPADIQNRVSFLRLHEGVGHAVSSEVGTDLELELAIRLLGCSKVSPHSLSLLTIN